MVRAVGTVTRVVVFDGTGRDEHLEVSMPTVEAGLEITEQLIQFLHGGQRVVFRWHP